MLSLQRPSRGERTNGKAKKNQDEKCENRGEKERSVKKGPGKTIEK